MAALGGSARRRDLTGGYSTTVGGAACNYLTRPDVRGADRKGAFNETRVWHPSPSFRASSGVGAEAPTRTNRTPTGEWLYYRLKQVDADGTFECCLAVASEGAKKRAAVSHQNATR